jgi:YjbE family integral membrane protein
MAGDNAIAVGLSASSLPKNKRHRVLLAGIGAATVLRILFAIFAVQILQITGLLVAGGLLLLWVCWKMFQDVRHAYKNSPPLAGGVRGGGDAKETPSPAKTKKISRVILQIIAADVSMSLDNVLAVAGVAREHYAILIAGLALSVLLMGAAASYIAKLTQRYPWIAYVGVAIVLFTALHMMWDGSHELLVSN